MKTAENQSTKSRRRSWNTSAKMEEITGKKFGDKENPLLVSVRSGARASMPGMMDTILNLGLNEEVVEGHGEEIRQSRVGPTTATAALSRCISDVVMEVGKKYFEAAHRQDEGGKRRYAGH